MTGASVQAFSTFGEALVWSRDLDPIYPVLQWIEANHCEDEEQRLWLTWLYLMYYNLPSALVAFQRHPEPVRVMDTDLCQLPIATERRNLRGNRLQVSCAAYWDTVIRRGTQVNWVEAGVPDNVKPSTNYMVFYERAQELWGNGRWAAFKWADLLLHVHGYPLRPPSLMLKDASGPLDGMRLFWPGRTVEQLDEIAPNMLKWFDPAVQYDVLETILCKYHSLVDGRYYVGHDIDELQENMERVANLLTDPRDYQMMSTVWQARRATLPHVYLGEVHGWHGVDKERKRAYAQTGHVVVRHTLPEAVHA